MTNEALSFCKQNNIDVWVWTVDNQNLMRRLVATGRLSRAQAARAYRLPLRLVGGHPGACISPSAR